MKSVEQEWEEFAGAIFQGVRPSKVQYNETRKAFYAGSISMFSACMDLPEIGEAEATRYLYAREKEFENFTKELLSDYAKGN